MSKKGRLLKNTKILFIGMVGTKAINFLMLPLYTRWLTVVDYGRIDIFTTVVSLFVPIVTLQIEQAVFRFLIDDRVIVDVRKTLSTGYMFLSCLLFCIDAISIFLIVIYKRYIYLHYLMAINLQSISCLIQQTVRGWGNTNIYTRSSIIFAFSTAGLSVILICILKLGYVGYVLTFCLATLMAIVYMLFRKPIYLFINISSVSFSKLKQLLSYAIPLIINNVSWWILNASDKLVLNYYVGVESNGIYAAAGKLPALLTAMYSVFHMAWQESAAREQGIELDRFYSEVFRYMLAIISYFVIVLLLCGRFIFNMLIDDKFMDAYRYMPILVIGLFYFCVSQFYGGIYIGVKKTDKLGKTSALAAFINVIINLLFVQKFEIFAVSISTLVSYFIVCQIRVFSIRSICEIKYKYKEIVLTMTMVVLSVVFAYIGHYYLQMIVLFLLTIAYCVLYKDILMKIVLVVRKRGVI